MDRTPPDGPYAPRDDRIDTDPVTVADCQADWASGTQLRGFDKLIEREQSKHRRRNSS